MEIEMTAFLTPDFIKFFLPLAGAVIAWFLNERRKRVWEEYKSKEQRYTNLILALKGFYRDTENNKLKQAFIDEFYLCWLYCPDDVIKKGYSFFEAVTPGNNRPEEEKQLAIGEFVASVRRDLLSRKIIKKTELQGSHFHHYHAK